MVFSSIPAYLDPANWQQQLNHQAGVSGIPSAPQPQPPPPPPQHGGAGAIRPGSLADRARLANIPMPEAAMKCPRCESTNTKFCYFNNYSLSQPRHFCKTCRRYWTSGGALRNVPVGGGCRRNKRSSSSSKGGGGGGSSSGNGNGNSKSPSTSSERASISGCSSSAVSASSLMPGNFAAGAHHLSPQFPPLRFMSPLGHYAPENENLGLNMNYNGFSGFSAMAPARENFQFQFGNNNNSSNNNNNNNNIFGGGGGLASLLSGGIEQWRVQTPMMGGLDLSQPGWIGPDAGPFGGGEASEIRPNKFASSSLLTTQMASVKTEDHNINQESSMAARQFMGFQSPAGNEQWGGGGSATAAAWSNVSASFSSSSTSNHL